jgi:hypothetical protein
MEMMLEYEEYYRALVHVWDPFPYWPQAFGTFLQDFTEFFFQQHN